MKHAVQVTQQHMYAYTQLLLAPCTRMRCHAVVRREHRAADAGEQQAGPEVAQVQGARGPVKPGRV